MTASDVSSAVERYFRGERLETSVFAGYGVALLVIAAILFTTRDRFARGLAGTLVVTALIALSTALPLLRRDGPLRDRLLAEVGSPAAPSAVADERRRMDTVIANYPLYRYGFVAAGSIALLLVLTSHAPLARGIAVGLLVTAATGVVIDHYSEARAIAYRAALDVP